MLVVMRDHDREVVYAADTVARVELMSGMNELLPLAGKHPGVE